MINMMDRLQTGRAHVREIDMLLEITKQVEGRTICALGDAAAWPIQELMRHFRPEVEQRIEMFKQKELEAGRDGKVLFGGRMMADVDPSLALPDNLCGQPEDLKQIRTEVTAL
jgi:NADH dehydrogenase (ubiquinone) flavoprotein 1